MTSWILYWRIGLRRRRSRVSRCSTASSPPSVSTVTSGCGASARSAAGSAAVFATGSADPSAASADTSAGDYRHVAFAMFVGDIMRCLGFGGLLVSRALDALAGDFRGLRLRLGPARRFRRGGRRQVGGGCGLDRFGRAERLDGRGLGDGCVVGRLGSSLGGHLGNGRLFDLLGAILRPCVLDVGAVDATAPPGLVILVGFGRQALLLGDQPFAVGDRDLIVVGMDFREGQEAVAVAAIFHERRLQRRFDADDLGQIDVALEGLAGCGFEIEFFKSCSIDDDHPSLLGVARIDEHAPCHGLAPRRWVPYRRERPAAKPPLWCEGDGAPSTRRTARHWPRRGSIAQPDRNWSCRPRVSYSHRLPDSPSADLPRPNSLCGANPARFGDCRRSAPASERKALRTTATARETQHTGFACERQSKHCVT